MNDELEIKPEVWYVQRQLDFKPTHFVTAKTPLTDKSAEWIVHNLVGRFVFIEGELSDDFEYIRIPAFEDSAEAVLYELKWS
jgi:hypothetical protein